MKLTIEIPDADAAQFRRNFAKWQQTGSHINAVAVRGILDRCKQTYETDHPIGKILISRDDKQQSAHDHDL